MLLEVSFPIWIECLVFVVIGTEEIEGKQGEGRARAEMPS